MIKWFLEKWRRQLSHIDHWTRFCLHLPSLHRYLVSLFLFSLVCFRPSGVWLPSPQAQTVLIVGERAVTKINQERQVGQFRAITDRRGLIFGNGVLVDGMSYFAPVFFRTPRNTCRCPNQTSESWLESAMWLRSVARGHSKKQQPLTSPPDSGQPCNAPWLP